MSLSPTTCLPLPLDCESRFAGLVFDAVARLVFRHHMSRNTKFGLAAAGAALVIVLGFFHFVQSSDGLLVIAKEHFSFSMTFTSVGEILRRNNKTSPFTDDGLFDHLVQELEHRNKIYSPADPAHNPAAEKELARIWKQAREQGVQLIPTADKIIDKYYPRTAATPSMPPFEAEPDYIRKLKEWNRTPSPAPTPQYEVEPYYIKKLKEWDPKKR